MSGYLLDTDICSYVIRRRPETLAGKFERHAHALSVSVITAAELRFGYTSRAARGLESIVEAFLSRVPVLDWTAEESWHYAQARASVEKKGTPVGAMDLLIASDALSRKLTLVTNNVKHFRGIPQLDVEVWT